MTGFRFYPVYQPQFRDEELEGKELQAKVTARYQIDSHVYEYLRYSCGFTSEEINRNKRDIHNGTRKDNRPYRRTGSPKRKITRKEQSERVDYKRP